MCAVCVSPAFEGWPIFILCGAGMQRREGRLTEALRSARLSFEVMETVRGASPVGGRPELHLRCWNRVAADDLPGAILLEDGAQLAPEFLDFLAEGGHFHASLTQFSHGAARVSRRGGFEAAAGVRLRPLVASTGLASGYAVSRQAARRLASAAIALNGSWTKPLEAAAISADWPCAVSQLDALVSVTQLVQPPDWLLASAPAEPELARRIETSDWRDLAAATLQHPAAERLRDLASGSLGRDLSPGY